MLEDLIPIKEVSAYDTYMHFYISIFKNSKITNIIRHGEAGPWPKGCLMTVTFEPEGQAFMAINGGPYYTFSPAISFLVNCKTQEEVDDLWGRLSYGGEVVQCGWLKDKYGISWQIIPTILSKLLKDPDPVKSQKVMKSMHEMTKINIEILKKAYAE